jgi:hypothetical protein
MPLSGKLSSDVRLNETKALDVAGAVAEHSTGWSWTVTNGTGANQADLIFSDTRTIAASGTDPIDLAGTLVPVYGGTLTLLKLKHVGIYSAAGNTNNLNVTTTLATLFLAAGDGVVIPPGGRWEQSGPGTAGLSAITPTTADTITVTNAAGATTVTYTIVLVGTSA